MPTKWYGVTRESHTGRDLQPRESEPERNLKVSFGCVLGGKLALLHTVLSISMHRTKGKSLAAEADLSVTPPASCAGTASSISSTNGTNRKKWHHKGVAPYKGRNQHLEWQSSECSHHVMPLAIQSFLGYTMKPSPDTKQMSAQGPPTAQYLEPQETHSFLPILSLGYTVSNRK